jgi:hypothetical protein
MHRNPLNRKTLYTLLIAAAIVGPAHAQLLGGGGSLGGNLGGGLGGTVDRIGGATAGGDLTGRIGATGSLERGGFGRLDPLRERTAQRTAQRAERAAQRARETTDDVRERAAETVVATRERVEQTSATTTGRAQSLRDRGALLAMRGSETAGSTTSRLRDRVDAIRPDASSLPSSLSASPIDANASGNAQAEGSVSASNEATSFDGRASASAQASVKRNRSVNGTGTP